MASSDCENDNDFHRAVAYALSCVHRDRFVLKPKPAEISSSSMMKKMCSCGYLQDMGNLFATRFLFDYKLGTYDHSGVSRNCQMGVLEKVGRSMPRARRKKFWGSSPRIFFCFTCSEIDSNAI